VRSEWSERGLSTILHCLRLHKLVLRTRLSTAAVQYIVLSDRFNILGSACVEECLISVMIYKYWLRYEPKYMVTYNGPCLQFVYNLDESSINQSINQAVKHLTQLLGPSNLRIEIIIILVVSALGIRARGPRFDSRVAPLFHWVATLGQLFTHIASPVSHKKGVFSAPKWLCWLSARD